MSDKTYSFEGAGDTASDPTASEPLSKANVESFLSDLAHLCNKYHVIIAGCECCGSPWLDSIPNGMRVSRASVEANSCEQLSMHRVPKSSPEPANNYAEHYWTGLSASVPMSAVKPKSPVCGHTGCALYNDGRGIAHDCCMCDYFTQPGSRHEADCPIAHENCHTFCVRRNTCIPF